MPRRAFLQSTGLAAAAHSLPGLPLASVQAQSQAKPLADKIRIAVVGCGGRGAAVLKGVSGEEIVALCDVDDRRAAPAFAEHPKAKRFKDFRRMFDQLSKEIEAVVIATPDHTHSAIALAAIGLGKHVYCEKPLAHTVQEVRRMRRAASEKKVITQVGNQGHSTHSIRLFREMVEAGAIGGITEIHAGCGIFRELYCRVGLPASPPTAVPRELDWDLWLGPLKDHPYEPAAVPRNWRSFTAYGSGCIGDWICHVVDPSYWTLDLGAPTAMTAEVSGYDPATDAGLYPRGSRITFEFPGKGSRGPVKLVWHDGDIPIPTPPELEEDKRPVVEVGAVVIGDQGKIMHGSHGAANVSLIPAREKQAYTLPVPSLPRVPEDNHFRDWLDAIRENRPAGSPFEYGGGLSEIGLLGVIAIRHAGQRLEWDGDAVAFKNSSSANAMLDKEYRPGWNA
jgi:predicted dehydrogenase